MESSYSFFSEEEPREENSAFSRTPSVYNSKKKNVMVFLSQI